MDHHRRCKDTSVIWPVDWSARGLLGGRLKEWDDVTILQLLFSAGTVADRSEWSARCAVSFILYLGQLQHIISHTISILTEIPPHLSFFFKIHSIYDAIYYLKKIWMFFFFDAFSLSGRSRDWRQRRFRQEMTPPPVRGAFPGVVFLPASHSSTTITFECVMMISTSRYAWGQTGFWLRSGNVRKAHTGNLCWRLSGPFLLTICKDFYLLIM